MEEVVDVRDLFHIYSPVITQWIFRYNSCAPPKLIRMWFDKAPMLFLIIAAVSFVIGLNLFAYLSLQVMKSCTLMLTQS